MKFYKYILLSVALAIFSTSGYAQTRKIDSLLRVLDSSKEDTSKTKTLVRLCWEMVSVDTKKAAEYGERSLQLSKKLNYTKGEGFALVNLAICKMRAGENDTALSMLNHALLIFEKNKIEEGKYSCYVNLGNFYKRNSEYPRSLSYYIECLKIAEKNKDTSEMADCYISLGLISSLQDKFGAAKNFYYKGLKLAESSGKLSTVASLKMNLGADFFTQNKLDSALFFFKDALIIFEKLKQKTEVANTVSNIGMVYAMQNNYDKALEFVFRGLKELGEVGDKSSMGVQYSSIAEIYLAKKDYKKSIEYFNKAIEIQKELNDLYTLKTTYENLAHLYSSINDYKQAYHFHVLSTSIKDSVLNIETTKQMTEMNTRYETEKKDAQIQLLNKDKVIQAQVTADEKRKHNTILFAVIIFLLFVLVLVFFIYKSNRRKQKDNEIITLQKEEVEKSKALIEHQKELVDEKQKEILDSIHYAKRIQNALLASDEILEKNLSGHENYFVYFKPKDIVSGDFYWATSVGSLEIGVRSGNTKSNYEPQAPSSELTANSELFYLAVCDSTGHGVPGAFMSLLNIGFLSEAIKEKDIFKPNEIFDYVRKRLIDTISNENQKDGFDGILVCFDRTNKKITYAASNNSPVIISGSNAVFLEADKMPVGKGERTEPFTLYTIDYKQGDILYLYTDGYADQFGGPKGKKFKYKQLDDLLLTNSHLSLNEQAQKLDSQFGNWKGELEQVDDVLMIGIKL